MARRIGSLILFFLMLLLPLSVSALAFDTGYYGAVDASQPLSLNLLADGTYRLAGGESKLYFYGRTARTDDTLTLFHGQDGDIVLELALERDGFRVKTISPLFFDDDRELGGMLFSPSALMEAGDLAGTYQLGKAFLRKLILNKDGTFELWRPPLFSYLPTGTYAADGHELVFYEQNGWELMRLIIQDDGFVVPDISASAARHFILSPGDVYLPLTSEPDMAGTYAAGDRRLELLPAAPGSGFTFFERDEALPYGGLYFAYNDRLFLVLSDAVQNALIDPFVAFEYRIEENKLVPLSLPHDDVMSDWADVTLERLE